MYNPSDKMHLNKPFMSFPFFDDPMWQESNNHSGLSVYEDNTHIYVEAHLPGLSSSDIDISYEKGGLWIRGQKEDEEEDKEKKYYKKASSAFSYHVQIPGHVDDKKEPEAIFKDGVLKVSFLKVKEEKAKKINIKNK